MRSVTRVSLRQALPDAGRAEVIENDNEAVGRRRPFVLNLHEPQMSEPLQILFVAACRDEVERLRAALGEGSLTAELRLAHTAPEIDAALAAGCDAVLADDLLPDALALVARVRAADADVPIVVLGDDHAARAAVAISSGADH